ncbi:MAG: penicillin-binding protein activator LpoB [Treponema sp.]|nr:penicillin-binding protein activator LpoB [Treponema sp.]
MKVMANVKKLCGILAFFVVALFASCSTMVGFHVFDKESNQILQSDYSIIIDGRTVVRPNQSAKLSTAIWKKHQAKIQVNGYVVEEQTLEKRVYWGKIILPGVLFCYGPREDQLVYVIKQSSAMATEQRQKFTQAIDRASSTLISEMAANETVAVISVSSNNQETASFVMDELEFQLVSSKKFKMVDRKTIDSIRAEQNFQMSGDVSDDSAVSIGSMLGATIVMTGTISSSNNIQQLTLKALDVKTARIIAMTREQF